jgi:recombinational DNA repair protein RecT
MTAEEIKTIIEREAFNALAAKMGTKKAEEAKARISMVFNQIVSGNPEIQKNLALLDPSSIAQCIYLSATYELYPGGIPGMSDVDLVVRKSYANPKAKDFTVTKITLQWQLNYRGLRRLVKRETGYDLHPVVVWQGDEFKYTEGMKRDITHVPDMDKVEDSLTEASLLCGYIVAYKDGKPEDFLVMRKADILARRAVSESYAGWSKKSNADKQWATAPIWNLWFHEMVLKTLITYAIRRGLVLLDPSKAAFMEIAEGEHGVVEDEKPQETTAVVPSGASRTIIDVEPASTTEAALRLLEDHGEPESLFEGAPIAEKVLVPAETTKQEEPATRKSNAPVNSDMAKRRAFELEGKLPVDTVNELRKVHGIEQDTAIVGSRYRVEKVIDYGRALRAAVDAPKPAIVEKPVVVEQVSEVVEDEVPY